MTGKQILVAAALVSMVFALAIVGKADADQQGKDNVAPPGFRALFNGKDFTGWKVPAGDNGHWKIINGVIDYDV